MKKLFFILAITSLLGCDSNNVNKEMPIDGNTTDIIGLPFKEMAIPSQGGDTILVTKRSFWWFTFAQSNDEVIHPSDNSVLSGSWFHIEKVGNQLKINFEENQTQFERNLRIGLEAGNYFDYLMIKQEK